MKPDYCDRKPSSFTETVELVENYVRAEIRQESKDKQLYYHTLDHALAVKRRASIIFSAIRSILSQKYSNQELKRLECLVSLCGLAHDMVQLFESSSPADQPRQRLTGRSETETANKLLQFIQDLNHELAASNPNSAILFSERDQRIIRDAIAATVCQKDPQAGKADYTFSDYSIYQPYLYQSQPKISIVGSIIALADLGALGMDGVEKYIQDGILVFIEDNPDYEKLILNYDSYVPQLDYSSRFANHSLIRSRLLTMTKFMVNFARERKARFELEIAGFPTQARQILRDKIFIYLTPENIEKIETIVPTKDNVSLEELIDFFNLPKSIN